jgi:hypothetical protein
MRLNQQEESLSAAHLQAIESQLFALVRQQAKRNHPVDLPRPDFWEQVTLMLQHIEVELTELGRTEGWSVRAQNLSRRQANLRRAVSDLTQHRLTAFVRHASASNLAAARFGEAPAEPRAVLSPLDWTRHASSERAFHDGLRELIERYKHHVSWSALQQGMVAENMPTITLEPGSTQLEEFIEDEGGLTGEGAPDIAPLDMEPEPFIDPDEDEEARIARTSDGWPAKVHIDAAKFDERPVDENASDSTENDAEGSQEQVDSVGMLRIRMLTDLPEPILDAEGNELELMQGDIEFCDATMAEGLITAGFAEDASL